MFTNTIISVLATADTGSKLWCLFPSCKTLKFTQSLKTVWVLLLFWPGLLCFLYLSLIQPNSRQSCSLNMLQHIRCSMSFTFLEKFLLEHVWPHLTWTGGSRTCYETGNSSELHPLRLTVFWHFTRMHRACFHHWSGHRVGSHSLESHVRHLWRFPWLTSSAMLLILYYFHPFVLIFLVDLFPGRLPQLYLRSFLLSF